MGHLTRIGFFPLAVPDKGVQRSRSFPCLLPVQVTLISEVLVELSFVIPAVVICLTINKIPILFNARFAYVLVEES